MHLDFDRSFATQPVGWISKVSMLIRDVLNPGRLQFVDHMVGHTLSRQLAGTKTVEVTVVWDPKSDAWPVGQTSPYPAGQQGVVSLVYNAGKHTGSNRKTYEAYGTVVREAMKLKPDNLVVRLDDALGWEDPNEVEALARGVAAAYLPAGILKTKGCNIGPSATFFILPPDHLIRVKSMENLLREGVNISTYENIARLLTMLPPNVLDVPTYFNFIYTTFQQIYRGIELIEPSEEETNPHEFGATTGLLNLVCRGSSHKGKIVGLVVHPESGPTDQVALDIGKGLCFDDGGQVSKGAAMKGMKADMGGSAAVFARALYFVHNRAPLAQTTCFVFGLAENRTGPDAGVIGEVHEGYSGKTVELEHPDAEGRLVLADAQAWALKYFGHENVPLIMRTATLTGAAMRAFGDAAWALVPSTWKNGERQEFDLQDQTEYHLVAQGLADPTEVLAPRPEFDRLLDSDIADMKNSHLTDPAGGVQRAGMFIDRHLPDDWSGTVLHCDIAGAVDTKMRGKSWTQKGTPLAASIRWGIDVLSRKE